MTEVDFKKISMFGPRTDEQKAAIAVAAELNEAIEVGTNIYSGSALICGLPRDWFDAWSKEAISNTFQSRVSFCKKMCARFQNEHNTLVQELILVKAELAQARTPKSESGAPLSPEEYRQAVVNRVQRIDPDAFGNALEANLRKGDSWAIKTFSDLMGLTVHAKEMALDDRPPAISFEYTSTEPDEEVSDPAQPQAETRTAGVRRPNSSHGGFRRGKEGR